MAFDAPWNTAENPAKDNFQDSDSQPEAAGERKTVDVGRRRPRRRKLLEAGPFEAEVGSFGLCLGAEGRAAKTVLNYSEAVRWFAAAYLLPETDKTNWEQVDRQDVQRWAVRPLGEHSTAYAGNQVRAIRRFLKWLAAEDGRPDPVEGLGAPRHRPGLVPVFAGEELSALRRACQDRSFEARRDAAVIEVFLAIGIRRAEMTGIRYEPADPGRGDLDLAGGRSGSAARLERSGS